MKTIVLATLLLLSPVISGCMLGMAGHGAGMGKKMGCGMDMDHGSMAHDSAMHMTHDSAMHTAHDSTKHHVPADTTTKHAIDSSKMEPMDHMHMMH